MRPRGIENWHTNSYPEALVKEVSPEIVKELNAELHRLATETEVLWSSFWARGNVDKRNNANNALVASCVTLMQFYEGLEGAGMKHHIEPDILKKADNEYWIACELLGKVIK